MWEGGGGILGGGGTGGGGGEMGGNAALSEKVGFDVDHLDDVLGEGWSVLLSGTARVITDPAELRRAIALGIEPWAGGERDVYIRLTPSQITARRLRVTG